MKRKNFEINVYALHTKTRAHANAQFESRAQTKKRTHAHAKHGDKIVIPEALRGDRKNVLASATSLTFMKRIRDLEMKDTLHV